MKKFLAVLVAVCLFALPLVASSSAAGRKPALLTSAGIEALRNEFDHDVAPEAGGHALDYAYYSPVGRNDNTKYPLVIFLHGIGHADYVGAQLVTVTSLTGHLLSCRAVLTRVVLSSFFPELLSTSSFTGVKHLSSHFVQLSTI